MKYDPKITLITKELVTSVQKNIDVTIPGLTAQRVLNLINALAKESNHYLEVGSFHGATACSALLNNNIKVTCIDNWQSAMQPHRDDLQLPENSKEEFIKNIKNFKGENSITIFDCDMFNANIDNINDIDLFFYDGDHEQNITSDAVVYFSKAFADTCICIFDDANFEGVVQGADEGIAQAGLKLLYEKKILNDIEDLSQWWNGLYITVVSK
jgi:hypothetical protein